MNVTATAPARQRKPRTKPAEPMSGKATPAPQEAAIQTKGPGPISTGPLGAVPAARISQTTPTQEALR